MKHDEIWSGFQKIFPWIVDEVSGYYKEGSRTIVLLLNEECEEYPHTLFFYYNNDMDWNLGTKMWRKRPPCGKETSK